LNVNVGEGATTFETWEAFEAGESFETWKTFDTEVTSAEAEQAATSESAPGWTDAGVSEATATEDLWAGDALGQNGVQYVKRWGPYDAGGPLPEKVVNTFRSGSYTELKLAEDTTLYRAYGGSAAPIRSYWSRTPPAGPVQAQMDMGLLPEWGNTATDVIEIKVPAGTTIYEGAAGGQSNGLTALLGGGNQVYIPQVDPSWVIH
jgi:hypothetical protein